MAEGGRGRGLDLVALSKGLSWLLRHNVVKEGLKMDGGGYVDVDAVLGHPRFQNYTLEDIKEVVRENDKQRFSLRDDGNGKLQIRANQGHSVKVDDEQLLHPITLADLSDYPVVIHGTYFKNWDSIKSCGLSRMNRNHIHFAIGKPGSESVISGIRHSAQLHIYIDLGKALEDGIKFYRSENNVILSPGNESGLLEPKYFKRAIDVKNKKEIPLVKQTDPTEAENTAATVQQQFKRKIVRNPSKESESVQLSKNLSWLLRHNATKEGLTIDSAGYVDLDAVLRHPRFHKFTLDDVKKVVAENDKKRFNLKEMGDGKLQIRANQGHSLQVVDDSELLKPITDPSQCPTVIHGTYFTNWESIKTKGISKMSRNHIHFAATERGKGSHDGVKSGLRVSAEVYVYIDIRKALQDGIKFYRSSNNVILSPGNVQGYLEPKYFLKAVDTRSKQEIPVHS